MCGIYGYHRIKENTPLTDDKLRGIINLLAIENQARGKDSTGISVIRNGKAFTFKQVCKAKKFLNNKQNRKKIDKFICTDVQTILGHTRYATTGDVNLKNAQPFKVDHIIGTHNGVIYNHEDIAKAENFKLKTTCDSEVIFQLVANSDTRETRSKSLESLGGYWSVAFIDLIAPSVINFTRDTNTLSIWTDKNKSYIIWSSEGSVIQKVNAVFNLQLRELKLPTNSLFQVTDKGVVNEQHIDSVPYYKIESTTYYEGTDTADSSNLPVVDTCDRCDKRKPLKWNDQLQGWACKKCRKRIRRWGLDNSENKQYGRIIDPDKEFMDYMRKGWC